LDDHLRKSREQNALVLIGSCRSSSISAYRFEIRHGLSLSQVDELLLVVDFVIQLVVVTNALGCFEWNEGLAEISLALLQLSVELIPLAVKVLAVFLVLSYCVCLAGSRSHLQCLLESIWINLFQDSLQSNERLLEDFMPVILGQINNDRDEHGEGFVLVRL